MHILELVWGILALKNMSACPPFLPRKQMALGGVMGVVAATWGCSFVGQGRLPTCCFPQSSPWAGRVLVPRANTSQPGARTVTSVRSKAPQPPPMIQRVEVHSGPGSMCGAHTGTHGIPKVYGRLGQHFSWKLSLGVWEVVGVFLFAHHVIVQRFNEINKLSKLSML